MERIEKHCHLLLSLGKLSKNQQKKVIESLTVDQLKFIVELASNLLFNDTPKLEEESREKIKSHKTCLNKLRKLASKKVPLRDKRKVVISGGFLPLLASILGSKAIESLLDFAIDRYNSADFKSKKSEINKTENNEESES